MGEKLELTNKEKVMLLNAIASHISLLYRQIEEYKKSENVEAIKDCFSEIHKFENLRNKF